MKKLLLILFLLIVGIQYLFNDAEVQALSMDTDVEKKLTKKIKIVSPLEEKKLRNSSNKSKLLTGKNSIFTSSNKKPNPKTTIAKAEVPIEVLVDEIPIKDFQYTRYRPSILAQSYEGNIREVDVHRRRLAKALQRADKETDIRQIFEDASYLFNQALTQHLLPKWYGTLWDFYGHCERPQEGFIACGYLVSTNLKHVGVNINRYTLAQQWPINMVQSLVKEKDIQHVYSRSRSVGVLEDLGYGLYIVGLDKHVGFIRYDERGMFFIHSNYTGNQSVLAESIRSSLAYTQTQNYYLAKLSDNREFLTKWLRGKRFRVKKS